MPVSFLCDREKTNIAKMQPGFINGITLPLWNVIIEIMPTLREAVDTAKSNS